MPVTKLHRGAIMQAAHRGRPARGLTMAAALEAAWAPFRRALRNRWPTHHPIMPFEQTPLPRGCFAAKPRWTRERGRLVWAFAA